MLVVDDEPPARRRIVEALAPLDHVAGTAEASDVPSALAALEAHPPDVVFLDIRMPGGSGLDVVRRAPSSCYAAFVFVTAYDSHAIEAFELAAADYLVKPFDDERLLTALDRAVERVRYDRIRDAHEKLLTLFGRPAVQAEPSGSPAHLRRLGIESRGQVVVVPVEEIDHLESNGNYVNVHVGPRTHLVRESLKGLQDRLDPAMFCRIHRSTIVNLARIASVKRRSYGDLAVRLRSGTTLRASRTYRDALARALGIEL